MNHRIEIEPALYDYAPDLTPGERDDLLAMLYCWRDEAVTDALRQHATSRTDKCGGVNLRTGVPCVLDQDHLGEHLAIEGRSAYHWRVT